MRPVSQIPGAQIPGPDDLWEFAEVAIISRDLLERSVAERYQPEQLKQTLIRRKLKGSPDLASNKSSTVGYPMMDSRLSATCYTAYGYHASTRLIMSKPAI